MDSAKEMWPEATLQINVIYDRKPRASTSTRTAMERYTSSAC